MNIKVYVKSLFIIYRYNNMLTTLRLKDREILDIKDSLSDILQTIRDLAQEINQDNIESKKREISELATNYELQQDLLDEKIEELPTTDKSNR